MGHYSFLMLKTGTGTYFGQRECQSYGTWLLSNVVVSEEERLEINTLFEAFKFHCLESGQSTSIGKRLFIEHLAVIFPNAQRLRVNENRAESRSVVTYYKGIVFKPLVHSAPKESPTDFTKIKHFVQEPFVLIKETEDSLTYNLDTGIQINGNNISKVLRFYKSMYWSLEICGKTVDVSKVYMDSSYKLCPENVQVICAGVMLLKLCEGVKVTGSIIVSRVHVVEQFQGTENKSERKVRAIVCDHVVPINTVCRTCRTCQRMAIRSKQKENIKPKTPEKVSLNSQIRPLSLTRETILDIMPYANDNMVELLLSQAKNVDRDPKGRRWSQPVIDVCLKWYGRSPQSYQAFKESQFLVLPSPSTLVLYKNRVKQKPGFDMEVFRWMHEEAHRRNIPPDGWTGGIIIDEMSIQADIQITKTGDLVELSGLVEIGEEGNALHVIRTGKNDKVIGTHALQMVFLGNSGFRFPFAHFITDGVQAPELHSLFWEAVDKLQKAGFRAVYTCMDGAQCNRSFLKTNTKKSLNKTITLSECNLDDIIFMMDISHVVKKIRNNVMKSGVQKGSTRLMTLPDENTIQWQMFIDCFLWDKNNAVQLHRRLSNEHMFPSSQSKMRNYLAEDVLNCEMLQLMQMYQLYLGAKGSVLDGTIALLQKTSKLISIFGSKKPIQSLEDERLSELLDINNWFYIWESKTAQKQLMSSQCHEDIHYCIEGFLKLCKKCVCADTTVFITPSLINSDVVENTFNQMRSTYNGANTNPNALQYRRTLNNIILGQTTVSAKGNVGKTRDSAMVYQPQPLARTKLKLNKRANPTSSQDKQPIKVIRC